MLCTVPVCLRLATSHCRSIYHIRLDRAVSGNQEMLILTPQQTGLSERALPQLFQQPMPRNISTNPVGQVRTSCLYIFILCQA
jgi:hypothetical protein